MNVNPEIIQNISLLYELSLSIGRTLVLEENCGHFLSVLMKRTNLSYASVWIKEALLNYDTQDSGYRRVYTQPTFRIESPYIDERHPICLKLEEEGAFYVQHIDSQASIYLTHTPGNSGGSVFFPLNPIGFLVIGTTKDQDKLGQQWMHKLRKVIDQFALSLQGSLAHRQIRWEIQERKLTEQKLRAARAMEEQFFANMSHEIRTPLNGMLGMMNLMLNLDLPPEQREFVQDMKVSGKILLAVLNDILDYSRIKQGKIDLERIKFDLTENLRALYHSARARGKLKGLPVSMTVDIDLPQFIVGDPVRLNQILENLISNALKFTHEGEVRIEVKILNITKDQLVLTFIVSDTGIGISKDKQAGLFEHFFQAETNTSRKYGGTGLGLAIVKKLLALMGGEIHLESELGKGTTFSFNIPFGIADQRPIIEEARPKQQEDPNKLTGYHFLLVEDTKMNQKVIKRMMGEWGAEITIVEDGEEAVKACKEQTFDLILMDVQMPKMDGYQATLAIRADKRSPNAKVPIIALTASVRSTVKKRVLETGMDAYLIKPFEPEQLFSLVRYYLNKRAPLDMPDSSLQQQPGLLNTAYLQKLSNGDEQFVNDMLMMFLEQVPIELENISESIQHEDWPALAQQVHKLKYPYASLGRKDLRDLLQELENLTHSNPNLDQFKHTFSTLQEATVDMIALLRSRQE